ncbi:hypothetical protein [Amycolatopsis alkalitolerans]|uniref:Uncharacterized protein n=1 Tax=Amycolatopsis alkalitolerans TaxID=2547244 RepID=A0A5C4M5E2_9PSEU|nr:hypothetical protein [Amycolatopsis alkalitolerans]TNC28475.1 hypothetical protein FG385_04125 [Amycolatopsis alkalitolerans]
MTAQTWPYLFLEIALLAWGLWLAMRRILDVTGGQVVAITGWTGEDFGEQYGPQPECGKQMVHSQGAVRACRVRIGDRQFDVDKAMYDRTPANCTNTAFLTPRTKRILNIARTPS